MSLVKKMANALAILCFSASELSQPVWAKQTKGPESEKNTLVYDHPEYGTISMEYFTYQDTELGLPLSYMKGTIKLQDKKYHTNFRCNGEITWDENGDPHCSDHGLDYLDTVWKEEYQLRIGMEFGKSENEAWHEHREQLRFIRHMDAPKWDSVVQSVTLFETAWDAETKEEYYKFLTLPEDDHERVDRSGKIGITVTGGTLDIATRTATIEFIRPFDVSRDDALTLEGGQKYQLWIQWGVFHSVSDDDQEKVKGMRSYIQKKIFKDHPGVLWEIQVPPPAPVISGSFKYLGVNCMLTAAISAAYILFN